MTSERFFPRIIFGTHVKGRERTLRTQRECYCHLISLHPKINVNIHITNITIIDRVGAAFPHFAEKITYSTVVHQLSLGCECQWHNRPCEGYDRHVTCVYRPFAYLSESVAQTRVSFSLSMTASLSYGLAKKRDFFFGGGGVQGGKGRIIRIFITAIKFVIILHKFIG